VAVACGVDRGITIKWKRALKVGVTEAAVRAVFGQPETTSLDPPVRVQTEPDGSRLWSLFPADIWTTRGISFNYTQRVKVYGGVSPTVPVGDRYEAIDASPVVLSIAVYRP